MQKQQGQRHVDDAQGTPLCLPGHRQYACLRGGLAAAAEDSASLLMVVCAGLSSIRLEYFGLSGIREIRPYSHYFHCAGISARMFRVFSVGPRRLGG